jgi:phage terminase small subunit
MNATTKPPKSKTVFPLAIIPRETGKAGRPPKSKFKTKRSIAVMRYTRLVMLAAPWLDAADSAMVRRFSELQVVIANLFSEMRENGLFDKAKQPRLVIDTWRRCVQTQAAIAKELGLSPLARKQLALAAQTDDLAAAMAKRVGNDDE